MSEEQDPPAGSESEQAPPSQADQLQFLALVVAQTITSHYLMHDARTLMRLGAGLFEMDLLQHRLKHSLRFHPELSIATKLRNRIAGALPEVGLTWDDLTQATASFTARFEERDPAKGYKPKNAFGRYTGIYLLCHLEIAVTLTTVAGPHEAKHKGQVDWPRDWNQLGL